MRVDNEITKQDVVMIRDIFYRLSNYGLIGKVVDNSKLTHYREVYKKLCGITGVGCDLKLDPRVKG